MNLHAGITSRRWTPSAAVRGMSLIELMVALLISSIVILGLVTLMNAIGLANRTQDGLARLQENGRFAVQRIARDLRAASAQHCSTFAGDIPPVSSGIIGAIYVDHPRSTLSFFNANANAVMRFGPTATAPRYPISSRFMMQGHECDAATCTPALAVADRGVNRLLPAIPVMGAAVNQRGRGADVITMRYLEGTGMPIVGQANERTDGTPATIELENDPAALARTGFSSMANSDPVWISDCASNALFLGDPTSATTITMSAGNFSNDRLSRVGWDAVADRSRARAFHVRTALRTVSYYLQVAADPRNPARRITALMRKQDDAEAQQLVQGVERLDFLYGVQDSRGRTMYLTATEVDALTNAGCSAVAEPGCGWRAVKSVEVYLLANTVEDVSPTGDDEFRYSWLNTGAANAADTYENPQTLGTLRNGLPAGRMLRREFRTLVSLRSFNH